MLKEENIALWRAYFAVKDEYFPLLRAVADAKTAWSSPECAEKRKQLERAQNYVKALAKSVTNLQHYLEAGVPQQRPKKVKTESTSENPENPEKPEKPEKEVKVEVLQNALAEKEATLKEAQENLKSLLASAPEPYFELQRTTEELERFCEVHGIRAAEQRVKGLYQEQAKMSRRNGNGMEESVDFSWRDSVVLPPGFDAADERLHAICNVTLGTRAMEFDTVIIRDCGPDVPVTCVAIVEVKSNANDIGSSFHHHQRSIAWLCGKKDSYDPGKFVSKHFPTGHFDRNTIQKYGNREWLFGPESFAHFKEDPVTHYYLENLYFAAYMDDTFLCAGCSFSVTSCLHAATTTPPSVTMAQRGDFPVQNYIF